MGRGPEHLPVRASSTSEYLSLTANREVDSTYLEIGSGELNGHGFYELEDVRMRKGEPLTGMNLLEN